MKPNFAVTSCSGLPQQFAPSNLFGRRRLAAGLALLAMLLISTNCASTRAGVAPQANPLASLTASEIKTAVDVLRKSGKITEDSVFPFVALKEPDKYAVLKHSAVGREVQITVLDRAANKTSEAVVDVTASRLTSWHEIAGAQAALLAADSDLAADAVRHDPQWLQAVARRGLDARRVVTEAWASGYFGSPEDGKVRAAKVLSYIQTASPNYYYGHPIEGLVAWVDLTHGRIIRILDSGPVPMPTQTPEYGSRAIPSRPALKALDIRQPDGPDFTIKDGEVQWQNWRFRFAVHPREGLVLYMVRFVHDGKERQIMYRGSLSEMVVPYASPDESWYFRNSFDVGELGVGRMVSRMRRGVECPQNSMLFDTVMADDWGVPRTYPAAVALYERDRSVAWKHGDDARRARELVLSSISTVGNYDYGFNWVFQQDGMLEMRVDLTGVMAVRAIDPHAPRHHGSGHLVTPELEAVHHQHFFCFRLDMDVDGAGNNAVTEQNTESAGPADRNPYGGAFHMMETTLKTDTDAHRMINLASSRRWKVINESVKNSVGNPTGFILLPGENAVSFAAPNAWIRKRAGFLNAHVWVTPYDPNEMYAAGDYPNQSRGGEGLPKWTSSSRPIDGKDVVLWYTLGITHIPRPEDWPIMPIHEAGFKLIPTGFFDRNPILDLP